VSYLKYLQNLLEKLSQNEQESRLRVLWLNESGSRAWNIESPDSDVDLRFIYKRSVYQYLNVTELPDTIQHMETEGGVEFDIVGWDIKKALKLFAKGNPNLLEWFRSPHVFCADNEMNWFQDNLDYIATYDKVVRGMYGLARKTYHKSIDYFDKDYGKPATIKNYIYAIRPLLAMNWMLLNESVKYPMDMDVLLTETKFCTGERTYVAMRALFELKRITIEATLVGEKNILREWIKANLEFYSDYKFPKLPEIGIDLGVPFRKIIGWP